ncbi:conserved hypothetical protein [Candidatus Protochlamydia naegleriophila]|uniref:Type III secretion chaperone SycE n=1 Tax=Candidatus Protochlamydia naegleriophila TaxID=389348 RepID=A0A0U5JHE1_9BACT|nr:type III secretion system chaperone [Candidatus Protochlamydia naegleriophila]CUI18018.1 conserved hypothetical protein [Candidatus Protochlamydia naegleriophila]
MLIEKDIKKILNQLAGGDAIDVPFEGSDIRVRFLDDASKLSLTTSIYYGGNYIPSSVRRCLSHKSPFSHPSIRTYLSIDEQQYQIYLNYLGHPDVLNQRQLKDLIEEFAQLAEQWRLYLDEHDKNDLVHVRVK